MSKLTEQGHEGVAAAPTTGVNTLTGEGLAAVLKGAKVIVDVSNSPSFEERLVMDFFKTSTINLLKYGVAAGVGHLAALSVVGTDRLSESPYFRAKIVQEKLIKESGLPYSIIHAPQFFEFVKGIADFSTQGNQVHVAPVLIQPMAADDVAKAVARVSVGTPVNGIVEVAGPEKFRLDELIRLYLRALGDSREVVADPNALYSGARLSERTLVPEDDAQLGEIRFEDWARSRAFEEVSRLCMRPHQDSILAPSEDAVLLLLPSLNQPTMWSILICKKGLGVSYDCLPATQSAISGFSAESQKIVRFFAGCLRRQGPERRAPL